MLDFVDGAFLSALLTIVSLYTITVVVPGPDFAMTLRNSLMYSRRSGVMTALGISLGLTFHATYTLVGVGALIQSTPWGFTIMKFVGAAYLVYIGWQSIRMKKQSVDDMSFEQAEKDMTPFQAFRTGFLTDALNPMAMMFFLTMFTVVTTAYVPPLWAKIFFTFSIFAIGSLWFTSVALCFSHKKIREAFARMGHWVGRVTGTVLVSLGIKLALAVAP